MIGDRRCRKVWGGLGIETRENRRLEIRVAKGSKGSVSQYEDRETGEGVGTVKGRRRQGKLCKRQKLDLEIQGKRLDELRRGCLGNAGGHGKEEDIFCKTKLMYISYGTPPTA